MQTPGSMIQDGWLNGARRAPSPNHDARPAGVAIDLVVVHGISLPPGRFGGAHIEQFFTNNLDFAAHPYFHGLREQRVSSHLLVRRDGELVQFVPFTQRAWHAGESSYGRRPRCNDFSIGIELEGTDDIVYTRSQYQQLAAVLTVLQQSYPGIDPARIVGHSDIAPRRKTDPGPAFDWRYLHSLLSSPASHPTAQAED